MERSHFRVVYDGPAVEDGEMDVSQLASSLLALGKLIENTDEIITGEQGRIRIRVQSDVRRGSFDVGLVLSIDNAWDALNAAKAWMLSPEGAATAWLLGVLGLDAKTLGSGLVQAVRWLRGRKVASKVVLADGNTELHAEDGEKLIVSQEVGRIIDEPTVRQPLERFTDPLREDGIETIRFEREPGIVTEAIEAEEAPAFQATAGADPTSTSRFEATYQIKRLYFEPGKKWRLSSGSSAIYANIEDGQFWDRVAKGEEKFTANDYLLCAVRMDQWFGPNGGLKTEYAVERVIDHIPGQQPQPKMI